MTEIDPADEVISEDLLEYLNDLEGLPPGVILTNVPLKVFVAGSDERSLFEEKLKMGLDLSDIRCNYLKSFRRVRVIYPDVKYAAIARFRWHNVYFMGSEIKCFFAQSVETIEPQVAPSSDSLEPPPLEKQFLISPPASPPVGWEQTREMAPVAETAAAAFNLELLTARLASYVACSEITELQAPTECSPGIIVYPCEESAQDDENELGSIIKPKIQPTPRPSRKGGSGEEEQMIEEAL